MFEMLLSFLRCRYPDIPQTLMTVFFARRRVGEAQLRFVHLRNDPTVKIDLDRKSVV